MEYKLTFNPPIVAIDVDGVLVECDFPKLGKLKPFCLYFLREIKKAGWRRVLFTCRQNKYLQDVKNYFNKYNIKFDAYNDNSAITQKEWDKFGYKDTRKIGYDIIVDDKSIFYQDNLYIVTQKLLKIYDGRVDNNY
ncbi:MAG: hypothetical protein ACQEQF_04980 [Bacillota bacterium]